MCVSYSIFGPRSFRTPIWEKAPAFFHEQNQERYAFPIFSRGCEKKTPSHPVSAISHESSNGEKNSPKVAVPLFWKVAIIDHFAVGSVSFRRGLWYFFFADRSKQLIFDTISPSASRPLRDPISGRMPATKKPKLLEWVIRRINLTISASNAMVASHFCFYFLFLFADPLVIVLLFVLPLLPFRFARLITTNRKLGNPFRTIWPFFNPKLFSLSLNLHGSSSVEPWNK